MDAWGKWRDDLKRHVTLERAQQLKQFRCVDDGSWRGVAVGCWETWGKDIGDESWNHIPSHQFVGQSLCEIAAEMLGEDAYKEPWN